jgi:hypothetical protein
MPGLVPGIHVFVSSMTKDVDGPNICANARKTRLALLPGHDEWIGLPKKNPFISLSFRPVGAKSRPHQRPPHPWRLAAGI